MGMTTNPTAPVRVPNVRPNAVSGLSHEPIGSNAAEAHTANEAIAAGDDPDAPTGQEAERPEDEVGVPDDLTTVDDLLAWVHEPADHDTQTDRAAAVLDQEAERPEDDQRSTLVEPLLAEYQAPPAE